MKKNVFVSYSSKDIGCAKLIVEDLEKKGLNCWVQYRDSKGIYASEISKVLDEVQIVLLILSKSSAVSENVQNEMDMVYKKKKRNPSLIIVPFCIEDNIDDPCFDTIMYYICRYNFWFAKNESDVHSEVNKILEAYSDVLGIKKKSSKERTQSLYYTSRREDVRLEKQRALLKKFDQSVYDGCFVGKQNVRVLDVGCGDGSLIFDRLANYSKDVFVIGVDHDGGKIEKAQNTETNIRSEFYVADVTAADFDSILKEIMAENGIEGFDIIHISMLLLHLKSTVPLLRILRRALNPNGVVIIKDIDDGLNFAYPDDNGDFEKVYELCDLSETSGNRNSGRQIYSALYQAGFRKIEIVKQGFSNADLSYDEKESMFDIYFTFILGDMKWMREKYPDDANICQKCEWYEENYESIRENFMKDDAVFSLGFLMFLASK